MKRRRETTFQTAECMQTSAAVQAVFAVVVGEEKGNDLFLSFCVEPLSIGNVDVAFVVEVAADCCL